MTKAWRLDPYDHRLYDGTTPVPNALRDDEIVRRRKEGASLEVIGVQFGISRERVRQIVLWQIRTRQ
jgi:hypothetical protein